MRLSYSLLIALGAIFGANARYLVGLWAADRLGPDFPYGTLIVNISGSFALGLLFALTTERLTISPELRLLLATGFLGAYTTFSSYTFESVALLRVGRVWEAVVNVLGNNLLGLLAALFGTYLGHWLGKR